MVKVRARPCLRTLRGLIAKQHDSWIEHLCFCQFQRRVAPISEETRSAPQDNRIDQEPIFFNEVMLHQRVDKLATAVDQDVLTRLLLQLGDIFPNEPSERHFAAYLTGLILAEHKTVSGIVIGKRFVLYGVLLNVLEKVNYKDSDLA